MNVAQVMVSCLTKLINPIRLLVTSPETLLTCVVARGPPQLWPKLAAAGHHFESVWSAACETGGSLSAFDTADPSE